MFLKPFRGARINRTHPLARGLVAAYLMNEGGGNQIFDIANNNTGTFVNNTSWDVGPNDKIIDLPGVDDYVNIPSALANLSGSIATFICRVRVDAYDSNGVVLFGTNTGTSTWFQIIGDGSCVVMANTVAVVNTDFDNGEFRTLAFVSDGTNSTVYNNGVNIGTDADAVTAFAAGAKNFHLGNWIAGATFDLNGALEWAYVFNQALSAPEIVQVHREPYAFIERSQSRGALFEEIMAAGIVPILDHYSRMMRN